MGFGLVQAPRLRFASDLASGALVEVLADQAPAATPVSILHPGDRHVPPRVRAFVDWAVATISPQLS